MIRIYLGNLGAGKSINAVREIVEDRSGRKTYTNIKIRGIKNVHIISPSEVITKTKDDKGKNKYDLNIGFWMKQKKPLNVVWDEIHLSMGNSRQSMSKANMVISRFIAMGRRITGFDERGYGHFTFIAQTERTIDVNIRELASEIKYMYGHWVINCRDCKQGLARTSEDKQIEQCVFCNSHNIFIDQQRTEIFEFTSWEKYYRFRAREKGKHYVMRYVIGDTKRYFKYYDTMQIEDLWDTYVHG